MLGCDIMFWNCKSKGILAHREPKRGISATKITTLAFWKLPSHVEIVRYTVHSKISYFEFIVNTLVLSAVGIKPLVTTPYDSPEKLRGKIAMPTQGWHMGDFWLFI